MLTALFVVIALVLIVNAYSRAGAARERAEAAEKAERSARDRFKADTERLTREAAAAASANKNLSERIAALDSRLRELDRFANVADADAEARRLIDAAKKEASNIAAEASRLRAVAVQEGEALKAQAAMAASDLRVRAQENARQADANASNAIAAANRRADEILAAANARAEEVAGEALKALREAKDLERAVEALKNVVEGYGDRYIVPVHSLFDDLADDFGHTEAGQRLKEARDHVRALVTLGRAATCEYVEVNRRETAIRFVVDAFNGKVDTILSRVKHDNAGTLTQEVNDAFALVNMNGKAFRDARVTPEYLTARLEELKWAALVQELKLQEREEQRRIKEQIREEEKARREIERAIRDAAKEEDLLKKAMEKAEAQMAKASEAQKATYESQLAELALRLKAAEERNQRAMSMAEQTRRGHVYIISNLGSFGEHIYKIGLTRRLEPLDRIRELGDSSVPFEFDVHALIFAEDAPGLEHQLHKHFVFAQVNKVNHRKEFFRVDLAQIREEIEGLGLTAQWTMAAAAREFRESQAIERAIAKDPVARDAWVKRQLQLEVSSTLEDDTEAPSDSKALVGTGIEDE